MIYASSTPSKRERGGIKTGIHVIIMLSDVVSIREILKAKSVLMRSLSPDMLLSDEVEFVDTLERANNAKALGKPRREYSSPIQPQVTSSPSSRPQLHINTN
jgi:hypothetical protein